MNYLSIIARISVAIGAGGLIGIERKKRGKAAGFLTNILVCMGSCIISIYQKILFNETIELIKNSPELANVLKVDNGRITAQIVSGMGFLGAGVILRDGSKIKGLNTAATLWCVAAIGTLCAAGLVVEATIGTAFVLLSNVILRLVSLFIMNKLKATEKEKYTIKINCKKAKEEKVRTNFAKIIDNNDLVLNSLERSEITEDEIKLKAIMITSTPSKVEMVINEISTNPGIVSVTWEHEKISKSDNEDSDEE